MDGFFWWGRWRLDSDRTSSFGPDGRGDEALEAFDGLVPAGDGGGNVRGRGGDRQVIVIDAEGQGALVMPAGAWVLAAERARSGRHADWDLAVGFVEHQAPSGKPVDVRTDDLRLAVTMQLGPQIVDVEQEDVLLLLGDRKTGEHGHARHDTGKNSLEIHRLSFLCLPC